jgi:hypothetical protein
MNEAIISPGVFNNLPYPFIDRALLIEEIIKSRNLGYCFHEIIHPDKKRHPLLGKMEYGFIYLLMVYGVDE